MEIISSLQNERIKNLSKLLDKKYRDIEGKFLVEGKNLVEEAFKSGLLLEVIKCDDVLGDYDVQTTLVTYEVIKKLSLFKEIIGTRTFNKIMEILLTDNGKEFINIEKITAISSKINLFYCHPYSSYEKGSIENNHELIRRVIPKKVSLKPYTQAELNLLCSHVNSLIRESLNGKCPFDLVDNYISYNKLKKMGLEKIEAINVCLIPELLGEKNVNNIKKYLDKDDIKKANIKFQKLS